MLEQKIKDWLKREMVMSKVSDQIQIKTYIHNNAKVTYAFIGGLPIQYCYFVAVMLSTYTNHLIPYEDYYRIIDILHAEWKDVVDITHYRKKYKKHMVELLTESSIYSRQTQAQTKPTTSVMPIFTLKQELKKVRHCQKKKTPDRNSLDIIGIIVQDMERIYESSYNDPVMI